MTFRIGDGVRWTSSNTGKTGAVIAVVPAGKMPRDVGFPKLGDTSMCRETESYVVRGGEQGRKQANYWPLVSLLTRSEGLSEAEIAWCHNHAPQVRAMMHGTP